MSGAWAAAALCSPPPLRLHGEGRLAAPERTFGPRSPFVNVRSVTFGLPRSEYVRRAVCVQGPFGGRSEGVRAQEGLRSESTFGTYVRASRSPLQLRIEHVQRPRQSQEKDPDPLSYFGFTSRESRPEVGSAQMEVNDSGWLEL